LGISTDSHHTHLAWIRTKREDGGLGKVNFPLIADTSKQISRSYGVLVEDSEDAMYGAALRGLFVIDPKGTVRSLTINDDAVGRHVDETLRLIKAFQYADTHDGEVCPASWKPGDRTMKANPEGVREYFRTAAEQKDL
jgi:peroxiredoxin (alkyl hydroperoxide reductase subunit C)